MSPDQPDDGPAGGPGRSATGNFILQALSAEATSRADPPRTKPILFSRAAATFAQGGHGPETMIDKNPGRGWAVQGLPKDVEPAAILTLAEPGGFPGGARMKLTLRYHHGGQHVLDGVIHLAVHRDAVWLVDDHEVRATPDDMQTGRHPKSPRLQVYTSEGVRDQQRFWGHQPRAIHVHSAQTEELSCTCRGDSKKHAQSHIQTTWLPG